LAQTATDLKGYIVEMMGYADTTGSAAMNTTLSEERAKNGNQLFGPAGQVPVRRIVAPGAMGEYGAAAPNETAAGEPKSVGFRSRP
jgi:OmpA-OmpF porin, OOP family